MPSSSADLPSWPAGPRGLRISIATRSEREQIYRIRHDVYARELGQHSENASGRLTDALDVFNVYIAASIGTQVVGFVSITPPDHDRYSLDKYVDRGEFPFEFDVGVFEVRILTVIEPFRGTPIAAILMYAALRHVDARGGTRIILMGRTELVDVYRRAGMERLGRTVRSGAVSFEVMSATLDVARTRVARYASALRRLEPLLDWRLGVPFDQPATSGGIPRWRLDRSPRRRPGFARASASGRDSRHPRCLVPAVPQGDLCCRRGPRVGHPDVAARTC